MKTFHYPLLHRKRAVLIVAAVKNHGGTFDFPRRVARMTRADLRRLFVTHRRIIGDEGARRGRGGDKVNTQASAHTIADHADARTIDVVSREAIAPAAIDHANEIR